MSHAKGITRRDFLVGAAGVGSFSLVPGYVLGGRGRRSANDKVNVAVIGTGGQGLVNIRELLRHEDVQVMALCDVNEESDYSNWYYGGTAGRKPALDTVNKYYARQKGVGVWQGCAEYIDFREMLDKEKDIDAVLVATPDHVHAIACMAAIKKGKHVYCEKPLAHSIYEARKIKEAAGRAKVATQMGNHGHSGEGIRLTCEWIWDGAIGPVREVHAWSDTGYWAKGRTDRPQEEPAVPSGFNWNLWQGPAAHRPYHPAYAPYDWRGWWDFGTGAIGDMACHNMDPALWALKLGHPETIEASSSRFSAETVADANIIRYTFPARGDMPPVTMTWYDGGLRPGRPDELGAQRRMGDNGIIFVGDKGKIICGGWAGTPRIIPETKMQEYIQRRPERTIRRTQGHHRDWLDACQGGERPHGGFDYSAHLTEVVLLGNVAVRTGKKIQWDGLNMKAANAPEAEELIRPIFQNGWVL